MVDALLLAFQIILPLIFFIPACVMLYLKVTENQIWISLDTETKKKYKLIMIYTFIAGIIMSFVPSLAYSEV